MMVSETEIATEVERRLGLSYTIEVRADEDGSWFAKVKELRGCLTVGGSRHEALEMLDDAMRAWMWAAVEDNAPIPDPDEEREFSGRFVIRVPASLHRTLSELAVAEGVSLNQLIVSELSKSVGQISTRVRPTPIWTSYGFAWLPQSVYESYLGSSMFDSFGMHSIDEIQIGSASATLAAFGAGLPDLCKVS